MSYDVIIKDTHRLLWYEDGILKQVLSAGRYKVRRGPSLFRRKPKVELAVVREQGCPAECMWALSGIKRILAFPVRLDLGGRQPPTSSTPR